MQHYNIAQNFDNFVDDWFKQTHKHMDKKNEYPHNTMAWTRKQTADDVRTVYSGQYSGYFFSFCVPP